ncbi:MAG: adenylosuccinate lyase, partial [Erysipelotrichaceae bacterium]|nr:adenylosuccinate lyase [Erysipelotrichaceae bacterium]
QETRAVTWRKLWYALARSESQLGLPISAQQLEELKAHISDIDYEAIAEREKEVRHDVMAHIYAYGLAAPKAAGIIHLGATSCYVTDNGDLIIFREALREIRKKLLRVMKHLAEFSDQYKDVATLSYTHYQPAQLTTVGKRAALWLQDFLTVYREVSRVIDDMPFLGCRGTTGTEASFMDLFSDDEIKIDRMNRMLADEFGFKEVIDVCGQTYPRILDSIIINTLSLLAQSACKFGQDMRLLQHDGELEEPFEDSQIGSSAMAYKRNPMRCERICSLSRYLLTDALNPALTASAQWLERTLDDSANRRISIPEAFLCADAILLLVQNVASGIKVNDIIIERNIRENLPFMITENLLMEAVKKGHDRQQVHEIIRRESMETVMEVREGKPNRLIEKLSAHPQFELSAEETEKLLDSRKYTGRSCRQVTAFLNRIKPLLQTADDEEAVIEI